MNFIDEVLSIHFQLGFSLVTKWVTIKKKKRIHLLPEDVSSFWFLLPTYELEMVSNSSALCLLPKQFTSYFKEFKFVVGNRNNIYACFL